MGEDRRPEWETTTREIALTALVLALGNSLLISELTPLTIFSFPTDKAWLIIGFLTVGLPLIADLSALLLYEIRQRIGAENSCPCSPGKELPAWWRRYVARARTMVVAMASVFLWSAFLVDLRHWIELLPQYTDVMLKMMILAIGGPFLTYFGVDFFARVLWELFEKHE